MKFYLQILKSLLALWENAMEDNSGDFEGLFRKHLAWTPTRSFSTQHCDNWVLFVMLRALLIPKCRHALHYARK